MTHITDDSCKRQNMSHGHISRGSTVIWTYRTNKIIRVWGTLNYSSIAWPSVINSSCFNFDSIPWIDFEPFIRQFSISRTSLVRVPVRSPWFPGLWTVPVIKHVILFFCQIVFYLELDSLWVMHPFDLEPRRFGLFKVTNGNRFIRVAGSKVVVHDGRVIPSGSYR